MDVAQFGIPGLDLTVVRRRVDVFTEADLARLGARSRRVLDLGVSGGASAPAYAATPGTESVAVVTANTGRDGTGTIATVLTAGSSGTRIEEVVAKCDGNPADSTLVYYLHDGSNYHVFDEWDIGDPAAGSTTVVSYREARQYANLILPTSWSLRSSITVTLTAGQFQTTALAGDF